MAAGVNIPKVITRLTKGASLTWADHDANVLALRDLGASLANLFGVSLNPDGTLKLNAVSSDSVSNRSITKTKLAFDALNLLIDSGTPNTMVVTNTTAPATAYADGQVFMVQAGNTNTSSVTLNVDGLGAIPVLKEGIKQVEAGDIPVDSVSLYIYVGGNFHLLGGAAASAGGGGIIDGNFTFQVAEPATQALPGAATVASFSHGLGAIPLIYKVGLECISADVGRIVGDFVPIESFFEIDADPDVTKPAFSVTIDSSDVLVEQNVATPKTVDTSTNNMASIDTTKWTIKVVAGRAQDTSRSPFPAFHIMVSNPEMAVAYGSKVFILQRDRPEDRMLFHSMDLLTSEVTHVETITPVGSYDNFCGAPYVWSDESHQLLYTSIAGLYRFPLQSPSGRTVVHATNFPKISGDDIKRCRLVWIDFGSPDVFWFFTNSQDHSSGGDAGAGFRVSDLDAWEMTDPGAGFELTKSGQLDFTNASIVNQSEFVKFNPASSNAGVMLCQYNPVKRRIYLATNADSFLHIFNLDLHANNNIADWFAPSGVFGPTYTSLTYEKALAIGGAIGGAFDVFAGGTPTNLRGSRERMTVEFDLVTGEEKSISLVRIGDNTMTGVVARVPWKEG